jgi:hypothetical protein
VNRLIAFTAAHANLDREKPLADVDGVHDADAGFVTKAGDLRLSVVK